jgi:hypothetical protein
MNEKCPNLQLLINQNKLVWLMTNEDTDIVNKFVDFIQNNYNLRKVSTNNIWNVFLFPKSVHFVLCEMYCSL